VVVGDAGDTSTGRVGLGVVVDDGGAVGVVKSARPVENET
jgi:hypothetical protein